MNVEADLGKEGQATKLSEIWTAEEVGGSTLLESSMKETVTLSL